jgi:hypothetical protein
VICGFFHPIGNSVAGSIDSDVAGVGRTVMDLLMFRHCYSAPKKKKSNVAVYNIRG